MLAEKIFVKAVADLHCSFQIGHWLVVSLIGPIGRIGPIKDHLQITADQRLLQSFNLCGVIVCVICVDPQPLFN